LLNKLKPKSEFGRNVLTLMTGTTIAQAIPIAISPILTRLYTPKDFGILALFVVITSIFGSIANGRYELAIMLPKKDEDAINLMALGFVINIFLTITIFIIILLFDSIILALLGNSDIKPWLYLIPITIFLIGCFNLLRFFNNRKKLYKDLAKVNVYKSIGMVIVQLFLGFLKAGAIGLISGQIFSQLVSNAKLFFNIKSLNLFIKVKKIKMIKMIALAKKYKKFPLYNLPNALIDGFRLSMINILIGKFFSISTLGQFSLAWRITQVPSSLIGNSISQVFFQKVSSSKNSDLQKIAKNFILKASFIATPLFLVIYLFAEPIFTFVFGKEWQKAGAVASILAPWLFLNFLTSPLSTIFIKLEKQQVLLIFGLFYAFVPVLILYYYHFSFLEAIELITFAMSLMLLIFIALLFYLLKRR